MATVFMKWLETTPAKYDRGIQLLTLGRLRPLKVRIASQMVRGGERVLEIGCGTGTLALLMTQRGASVTGIDASPLMLDEARRKVAAEGLSDQVVLIEMGASRLTERFAPASFDVIVSTLIFSELSADGLRFVLDECRTLLAPGGRLIVADEVVPHGTLARLLYYLVRLPLILLTWLLTRTTTHPLRGFPQELAAAGFRVESAASFAAASLELFVARSAAEVEAAPAREFPRLRHQVTLRTLLTDLWCLFLRIIPPYPRVRPGLYRVGEPDQDAPVLVTANFDLTVRRVVQALDGQVNAWLLVADSAGINVWCGAGGGYFTADKVIAAVKTSGVERVVERRVLILPQLAANGVDGRKIHRETGWRVRWGPVYADDIPAYLEAGQEKSDAMRRVTFPLKRRLEMVTVTLGFYGLMILLPVGILWRSMFWPITASLVGLSYFYAVVHPWLPGRDGLAKSIPLTLITLAGLLTYTALWGPLPIPRLFNWAVGLTGLSVFTAGELQGMSPLMRGEQANWGWEALVGAILGLACWLVPLVLGWR